MIAVRSKIVAGNYRDVIGVSAIVAMVTWKVDAVNAGNEFTKSQGSLLGIGFHGLMFTPRNCADVMGSTPHWRS